MNQFRAQKPVLFAAVVFIVLAGVFPACDGVLDSRSDSDRSAESGNEPTPRTYSSGDIDLAIPDYDETGVESIITVDDGATQIGTVVVTIFITHTLVGDLHIFLESPGGTRVALSQSNGGSGENYSNTIFDDGAETSIQDGTAPFSGAYRPESALAVFHGENANGDWTLSVYDYAPGDIGILNSWSISIMPGSADGTGDDAQDDTDEVTGDDQMSITLTEPRFSVTWQQGSRYTIRWDSENVPGDIDIFLTKNRNIHATIATQTPNTGSYRWLVPTSIEPYDYYNIRVQPHDVPEVNDGLRGSSVVRITPASHIEITSPTASSNWGNGTNKYIQWNEFGAGDRVTIELWRNQARERTISSSAPNNGSYYWRVQTSYLGVNIYRIKVISNSDAGIFDFSPYFSSTF